VLMPRVGFPLSNAGIGRAVRALDRFMSTHSGDDALVGQVVWLPRELSDAT
jgi:hypothetical protein